MGYKSLKPHSDRKDLKKIHSVKTSTSQVTSKTDADNPQIVRLLFSADFIVMYLITLLKTSSSFYCSAEIKTIGMLLIGDDAFLTKIILGGILLSMSTRLSMGWIYNFFGMKMTYFVNLLFELLSVVFLFFFGHRKLGFAAFGIFTRISSGRTLIRQG